MQRETVPQDYDHSVQVFSDLVNQGLEPALAGQQHDLFTSVAGVDLARAHPTHRGLTRISFQQFNLAEPQATGIEPRILSHGCTPTYVVEITGRDDVVASTGYKALFSLSDRGTVVRALTCGDNPLALPLIRELQLPEIDALVAYLADPTSTERRALLQLTALEQATIEASLHAYKESRRQYLAWVALQRQQRLGDEPDE